MLAFNKIFHITIIFFLFLPIIQGENQTELIQHSPKKLVETATIILKNNEKEKLTSIWEKLQQKKYHLIKEQIKIQLPNFGMFQFYPTEKIKKEQALEVTIEKPLKFEPIPIVFNYFNLLIKNGMDFILDSQGSVFGKKAKFELIKLSREPNNQEIKNGSKELFFKIRKIHIKAHFTEPFNLPISPNHIITLNNADLFFEKDKSPKLIVSATIFNHPTTIYFNFYKDKIQLNFIIPSVELKTLSEKLKEEEFKNINLQDLHIKTNFTYNFKDIRTTINGIVDFSKYEFYSIDFNPEGTKFTIQMNQTKEFYFEASLPKTILPVLGKIEYVKIIIDVEKNKNKTSVPIKIKGTGNLLIPELGSQLFTLSSKFTEKEFTLEGKFYYPITYKKLELKNPHFKVKSGDDKIEIYGKSSAHGLPLDVILKVNRNEPECPILFKAKTDKDTWNPFEFSDDKQLKNITLHNLEVHFEPSIDKTKKEKQLTINGISRILNIPVIANIQYIKNENNQVGTFLQAKLPAHWKFSDSFAEFKNSTIDEMSFLNPEIIASNIDFVFQFFNKQVKKGINLFVNLTLHDGILKTIEELIGTNYVLSLSGPVRENPNQFIIKSPVSHGIKLDSDKIFIGQLTLEITSIPSIELIASIIMQPSPNDKPLFFFGQFDVNPENAKFHAQSNKPWENALGNELVKLKNVTLNLYIPYNVKTTYKHSHAELKGTLELINTSVELTTKDTLNTQENTKLEGIIIGINLADLISSFDPANNCKKTIPYLNLEPSRITIEPFDKQRKKNRNIIIDGKIKIANTLVPIKIEIAKDDIKGTGSIPKLNIGPLIITGIQTDKNSSLKLICNPKEQKMEIKSQLKLDNLFDVESPLILSVDGIHFEFDTQLSAKKFDVHIVGSSPYIETPKFRLKINFSENTTKAIETEIKNELNKLEQGIINKIKSNIKNYEIAQNNIKQVKELKDEKIKISKLEILKKTEETFKNYLEKVSKYGLVQVKNGKFILIEKPEITEKITIKSIHYDDELEKIKNGIIPNLTVDTTIFNEDKKIQELVFDLNNPDKFIENLKNRIFAKIREYFEI